MAKLSREDRNNLLKLLDTLPTFQTYRGRKQLIEFAGLEAIIPQIDLEGATFVVAGEVVQALEGYGRISYERAALGMFLNAIKEFIGAADEKQSFIDELLRNYSLMTPIKKAVNPIEWKTTSDFQAAVEKIVEGNPLRHIFFLKRGLEASPSVALIDVSKWTGTGFMISPDFFMTNNDILPDQSLLTDAIFRFNYQLASNETTEKTEDYKAIKGGRFYTNDTLNYTVVELDGKPGNKWGFVHLNPTTIIKGDRVNIIQHPAGLPKQISFQNNVIEYADSKIIQYLTSTMGVSPGSPIFDDKWQVVALHHASLLLESNGNSQKFFRNEGIAIGVILKDLPEVIREKL